MLSISSRLSADGTPAFGFGGDYNPEQWHPSVWQEDVALMKVARVNLVSVGIFSWALLEPSEGRYEFGWLDDVLDLLHESGIRVDLANASASPPPWFSHRYPQSLPVTANGVRLGYGSRQAFCASSPEYRRAAAALTTEIAKRYASHPAVVMWHVHNEYGCITNPATARSRGLRSSAGLNANTTTSTRSTKRGAPPSGRSVTTGLTRSPRRGNPALSSTRPRCSTLHGSRPMSCSTATGLRPIFFALIPPFR